MSSRRVVGLAVVVVIAVVVVLRLMGSEAAEEDLATDVAVHVGEVARATLHRYVTAYGTVEPRPALDGAPAAGAMITPFVDGVVSSVEVVEGRRVARGTILFRLDSRLAEVAVRRAREQVQFADSAFQRQQELLASDGTSRRAYLEARLQRDQARSDLAAAETELAYLSITAPLAGTVLRVTAEVGRHVDTGTVLAQVVNLDRLVVTAGVPAREIAGVAVGQRVLIGAGDDAPEGAVLVRGRDVDPADGTYRVQVSLPPESDLVPGQFTDVRIIADEHPDVLVVPVESVVSRGVESWVMVVEGDRAVRSPVTVGLREGDRIEISGEGVDEGTPIVTTEAYSLPEQTRIHVVGG
jgi:membrane fusion protein (multidrug efflux system)